MTPEQIEKNRFEVWCRKNRPHLDLSIRHDGLKKEYEDCMADNLLEAWLAAKQDSEQQRKELQERINHDPQY